MKRLLLILTGLIIVMGAIFTGWYFFLQESRYIGTPAMKAVAPDAPLFVEINNVESFMRELKDEHEAWNQICQYAPWKNFNQQLTIVDSVIQQSAEIKSFTSNKKLTISFDFIGKETLTPIYIFPLNDITEKTIITEAFNSIFKNNDIQIVQRKYNGTIIYNASLYIGTNLIKFYYAFPKGLAVLSSSSILVENTILQTDEDALEADPGFKKIHKTVGTNKDINLYINHQYFPRVLKQLVNNNIKKQDKELAQLAHWTELDIDIKKRLINWNGFTNSDDSLNQYMNIFKNQSPGSLKADKILPSKVIWFKANYISDFEQFQNDYSLYIKGTAKANNRDTYLRKFKNETGTGLVQFINGWINHDIAFAACKGTASPINYLLISTRSESLAKEECVRLLKKYCLRQRVSFKNYEREYKVDKETSFKIYKNPYPGFHKHLFGNTLADKNFRYFSFINNHVIFSETFKGVSEFLYENVLHETLGKKDNYLQFTEKLSRECNIYFYCQPSRGIKEVTSIFDDKLKSQLMDHEGELRKFSALGWKAGSSNKMVYNNGCLEYNPDFREAASTKWQSHLDSSIDFKPQFVTNHRDRENKEVIVQDRNHQLYLINKLGRIIWKLKLSAPILGEIHQVDLYKNGKLQYLFNTPDKLHIVDRNGNYVDKYPINFRSPATNGVAVFDYDRNRNYRIFVACQNKKVYAYDKYGKIVTGWKFGQTEGKVSYPIKHLRLANKDYIVFNDQQKIYILDRRGSYRVKTKGGQNISNNPVYYEPRTSKAAPRLVYTTQTGKLHYQYFNGAMGKKNYIQASQTHLFTYSDIDSDGIGDAIIADGKTLKAYNASGRKIIQQQFNVPISDRPNIYSFSKRNKKIGIVTRNDNRISLINSNGNIYKGFPLDGSSSFSIGFFTRNSRRFNLVVGNKDGFLYNYVVD